MKWWVICHTLSLANSPASVQAQRIGRRKNMITSTGWTGLTVILHEHSWRCQPQEPAAMTTSDHLPRLSRKKNMIQMAGLTGPTLTLLQQGWERQTEEPATQTTFKSLALTKSWWLENDRTMSFSRPICSDTNWPSTTTDGCCGLDWAYDKNLFSVALGRTKIPSLNLPFQNQYTKVFSDPKKANTENLLNCYQSCSTLNSLILEKMTSKKLLSYKRPWSLLLYILNRTHTELLKMQMWSPYLKKGDCTDAANYKSISITSHL